VLLGGEDGLVSVAVGIVKVDPVADGCILTGAQFLRLRGVPGGEEEEVAVGFVCDMRCFGRALRAVCSGLMGRICSSTEILLFPNVLFYRLFKTDSAC